jgi:hypothetical protein
MTTCIIQLAYLDLFVALNMPYINVFVVYISACILDVHREAELEYHEQRDDNYSTTAKIPLPRFILSRAEDAL